ncbi:death domain-containing protein CRADD-like [Anneissia japonica]|uniref:death domain-containing protein CRADD-like n=1 Tax=Anneissia japonica TaxID=1529436 RepID=UPI0014258DDF|nr:death domain-containing protein CRADD-like [Anneissia japonica]XP_033106604.1 death domain-containing protein CRADD-like [Anneissia japonica]XP_033106605.1 death domain-containing protein CRADD-like [Anneissia japonica]
MRIKNSRIFLQFFYKMDERHKFILQKNRRIIADDLDTDNINNYLIQEFIFTPDVIYKIRERGTRRERTELMLDLLPNQGERAFYIFLKALSFTYPHLYETLLLDDRTVFNVPQQPVQCSENPVGKSGNVENVPPMPFMANQTVLDYGQRQIASPQARVTERDLARISAKLSGNFSIIAGMLGLTSAELYQCQVQHQHSVKDQYFAILYTWRRKNGYGASRANLVELLREMNVDCSVYEFMF